MKQILHLLSLLLLALLLSSSSGFDVSAGYFDKYLIAGQNQFLSFQTKLESNQLVLNLKSKKSFRLISKQSEFVDFNNAQKINKNPLTLFYLVFLANFLKPSFDYEFKNIARNTKASYIPASVKSLDRILEKLKFDYQGNIANLKDILRGSLVFDNFFDLYKCLDFISQKFEVIKVKDRFKTNNKYKDVNIVIRFHKDLKTEIQLHLKPIFEAKKIENKIYQKIRKIKIQLKQLVPAKSNLYYKLQNQLAILEKQRTLIYDKAWLECLT